MSENNKDGVLRPGWKKMIHSKAQAEHLADKMKLTDEDKEFMKENFEENKVCCRGVLPCLKGCTTNEYKLCPRTIELYNERTKNSS